MLPDDGPFDVFLEGGRIADIAPAGALPPRGVVLDADGAWLIPGLWDHHVHVMQWALVAAARTARACDLRRARGVPHGCGADPRRPTSRHRVPRRLLGGRADPRAARRRDRRHADLPHQRRRAQRLAQQRGAAARGVRAGWRPASSAKRPPSRSRAGSTRSTRRPATDWSQQMATDAAARGVVGLVDFDMAWNHERLGAADAPTGFDTLRVEFGIYPEHLDRAIAEGLRTGDGGRRRGIRSRPCRFAQGHHRRLPRHAHGRVLARVPGRSAQPRSAHGRPGDARRADDARPRARGSSCAIHAIGDVANSYALDAFAVTGATGHDRARAARRARRHPALRPARRGGERAARARARRPRPDRHDLGRADRARLPAARARRAAERTCCSARTLPSRRSTRGRRWRARCSAPATGASRGTPDEALDMPHRARRIDPRRLRRAQPARTRGTCRPGALRARPRCRDRAGAAHRCAVRATLLDGRLTHAGLTGIPTRRTPGAMRRGFFSPSSDRSRPRRARRGTSGPSRAPP